MTKTELKTLENEVKTELIKEGFDLVYSNLFLVERTFSNVVKKLNLADVTNRGCILDVILVIVFLILMILVVIGGIRGW